MTLAIAHLEKDIAVLDLVREWRPPFSPEAVVQEIAAALTAYGISTIVGDRYGGEWPRERFRNLNKSYKPSDKSKTEIYQAFLPLVNSGHCELPENQRLTAQLTTLERRTARGGRDSIDHPPNGRDDVANAVAGALVLASKPQPQEVFVPSFLTSCVSTARSFETGGRQTVRTIDAIPESPPQRPPPADEPRRA